MQANRSTSPLTFLFLVLPYGISGGFVLGTLPFALTQAGFAVATTASIVALGVSASVCPFLFGPMVDLTLTLRRWYVIGLSLSASLILLVTLIPFELVAALTLVVFLSQLAATLIVLPVGGQMAHTVEESKKGRAAGWYQAGNLGGGGLGSGAGIWLTDHYSFKIAGMALAAAMAACVIAPFFVPEVRAALGETVHERIRGIGRDFRDMLRSPVALLVMVLVTSPIGAAAMSGLWPAVAPDWKVSADTVALTTGVLTAVISVIGCAIGGSIADRVGRWWAYFGSGTLLAVVAVAMAMAPRTSDVFVGGVLSYAFATGLGYAAYSTLVLLAIGQGAASTKYSILSSIGNIPCAYMAAFNGWMHDETSAAGMLWAEALVSLVSIVLAMLAVRRIVFGNGNVSEVVPVGG